MKTSPHGSTTWIRTLQVQARQSSPSKWESDVFPDHYFAIWPVSSAKARSGRSFHKSAKLRVSVVTNTQDTRYIGTNPSSGAE